MSESQSPYEVTQSVPDRWLHATVTSGAGTPTDDLDMLLVEMRRGLLQVIRAIEHYQEHRLTRGDKP